MKRASKTIRGLGSGKVITLKCQKHDIPYTMEASRDPVNEGAWKHFYCEKCRKERSKDGTATIK